MTRNKQTENRKTGVAAWNESEGVVTREVSSRQNKAESDKKRRMLLLAILAVVCVAAIVCAWPIKEQITRGLWLKEGVSYSMVPSTEDGSDPSQDVLGKATSVVGRRLGALDVQDAAVILKDGKILIEFPQFVDQSESLAKTVGGKGKLELIRSDEIGDADALAKINAGTTDVSLKDGTYTSFMDGSSISSATVTEIAQGYYAITLTFTDEGSKTFADVTRELAESSGSIAIAVDGRVLSMPSVSEEMSGGQVTISGVFSKNEANAIKSIVDTGELPITTAYDGSENVGPFVGKTVLWGLAGAAVVVLVATCIVSYMCMRKLAVVVGGTLAVYGILLLGLMALGSRLNMFVLTMPGVVAAFVGAAAVIVASWRLCASFRSHVASGGSYKGAAITCVKEGFGPLAGPCALVGVICIVFLFLPVSMLRDFGTAAVLAIVCGLITLGWYSVTTLRYFAAGPIKENPEAWGVVQTAEDDAQ